VSKLLFPALFFIGSPVVVIDYSSREMDTWSVHLICALEMSLL
jgi:hypothetical protein